MLRAISIAALMLTFAAATADEVLLIPDSDGDRIMLFSPVDGTLIDPDFIPDPGVIDSIDIFDRPLNAILAENGNILVADQFSDLVAEFDETGAFVRVLSNGGSVNTMRLANVRGIETLDGSVIVSNAGSGNAFAIKDNLQRYSLATGDAQDDFAFNQKGGVNSPFDVLVLPDRVLAAIEGYDMVIEFDFNGAFTGIFAAGIDFPQQINLTKDNTLLIAQFGGGFVTEFDQAGNILGNFDTPQTSLYRGAIDLDNGNLLVSTSTGVHEIGRNGLFVETEFAGSGMRFIERVDLQLPIRSGSAPDARPIAPGVVSDIATDAQCAAELGEQQDAVRNPAAARAARPVDPAADALANLTPRDGAMLRGATTLAGEKRIYILEDSGFFGAPGITLGRVGVLSPSDPSDVTLLSVIDPFAFNWGGIDFRGPAVDSFFAYDNLTNTARAASVDGGQSFVDSTGWIGSGVAGLTFSNTGEIVYAGGTSGFFGRVVASDPDTAEILGVYTFSGESGINALATVPPNTDLPFPAGQIWALQNTVFGGAQLLRLDVENEVVLSSELVSPIGFTVAFEGGLDFAPDGTLYAAIQGVQEVAPDIFEDRSSRLYQVDPETGDTIQLGVIDAEGTWDVSGLSVLIDCPATYFAANWLELDPCLLGPTGPRDPACYCADADADLDIDLTDLAEFQVNFGT